MGDCRVTAADQRKQDQRSRGPDLPQLQEPCDSGICLDLNQEASVGGQVTQCTSSRENCKNGDMDMPCSGSSNMDHLRALNGFDDMAGVKLYSKLPEQEQCDSRIGLKSNHLFCVGSTVTQPTSSSDSFKNEDIDVQCSGSSDKNHQRSLETEHSDTAAAKFFSNLPELQGQRDSRMGLDFNQESCVGGLDTQHTSSGDGRENGDMNMLCSGSSNLDRTLIQEASVARQVIQRTSSHESCKNGDMGVPGGASSNMGHTLNIGFGDMVSLKSFSKLPEQEQRDVRIALKSNQLFCVGSRATQPTSSGGSFKSGDIDVQCSGSSDKNHQCSLENEHSDIAPGKFFSDLPELQGQHDSRIGLDFNQESCVGGQGDQHTSSGTGRENGHTDVPCSDSSNLVPVLTPKIKHGNMAAGKTLLTWTPQQIPWKKYRVDCRNQRLLLPNLSWEEKVVYILHMVRFREIFEYNPKASCTLPTRFCLYNIAFFDHDKESDFKREPRFSKIPDSFWALELSMNIISIKVAESDVPYPINIYGTVLVRDEVDYRCVYLFKRGRDNPQRITSADDTLTLTGPHRALAGEDHMFFEFNLKIKGEETVDQDFSKGLLARGSVDNDMHPLTLSLGSCLSEVKMEFINVPYALEASVEVNILNKKSYFHGRIAAGDNKNGILLYNSKVAGTETKLGCGGSVSLTRHVVAVPWGSDLVLHFSVPRAKRKSISLECDEEECTFKLGTYELQVKIIWTGVLRKQHANVLKKIGRAYVLW